MAFLTVGALLALALSAQGSVGPSTNNSFCTETKECLQYKLVCKTDEYEVRHYNLTRWVSTDAEAYFMGVGAAMAFRRLFQYITGANEGGFQMDMTAPVLVKIPEETKMWEPAVYTLNFLMPSAYQDKPPVPTNNKLYFTEMPEMDVYVRGYGGWMLSVTSRLHAHLLTKELERVRASYNYNYHYGVGYDSPLKLLNRHNEVWYVAQGEPVCTDPTEPTAPHPVRLLQSEQPADTFPDLPSDPPSDPPSQQPDVPSPAADNETTSNSSHTRPTSLSPSQASSSPLSHQPTDAALSQAPTSVHTALEQTSSLSDPSFPVSPPVDAQGNSTKTEPADLPHDAQ